MSKVAVVILNFNGAHFLRQFLPTLINATNNGKIIVADNGSTDDSLNVLKNEFPQIQAIDLAHNHGFAEGYNLALKSIESDYYVLLNSDVEVTAEWLTPMIDFLDNHPDYAACQPKIKDFKLRNRFEYAGACGGHMDFMGYPYCRGRIFDTLEQDDGQYDEPTDIFWASGACLCIRSSVFHETGGFDGDFFAHMEEIDLCWRIHSLGYKIRSTPQSTVYHVGGGTLSKASAFKTYLNFRNGLYLLIKNLSTVMLIFKFPVRIVLDWIAALKFLLEGNPSHGLAVIRAHLSVGLNLWKFLHKRKHISKAPHSKLLIYEYYLKGNRKFSEL